MKNSSSSKITSVKNLPFEPKWYEQQIASWFAPTYRRESVCVQGLSRADQLYRLKQIFAEREQGIWPAQVIPVNLQVLNCDLDMIEEPISLKKWLNQWGKSELLSQSRSESTDIAKPHQLTSSATSKPVIVVVDTDRIVLEKQELLPVFEQASFNLGLNFVFLFEQSVTGEKLYNNLRSYSCFFQNSCIFPLLDKENSGYFLEFIATSFNVTIPKEIAEEIIDHCAGQMWLMKSAVRHGANGGQWSSWKNNPLFIQKVELWLNNFNSQEKSILENLVEVEQGQSRENITETSPDFQFLLARRILQKNKQGVNEVAVPVLSQVIAKKIARKSNLGVNELGNILQNNVLIDNLFSRRERRLLRLFIKNPGVVHSREACAKAVWAETVETDYTDWALDQVIKRLRKKLVGLGLSAQSIELVRGRGYRYVMEGSDENEG